MSGCVVQEEFKTFRVPFQLTFPQLLFNDVSVEGVEWLCVQVSPQSHLIIWILPAEQVKANINFGGLFGN